MIRRRSKQYCLKTCFNNIRVAALYLHFYQLSLATMAEACNSGEVGRQSAGRDFFGQQIQVTKKGVVRYVIPLCSHSLFLYLHI